MSLDLSKLENVRERGGKTVAACPACREVGVDRKGEHLIIYDDGRFACVANSGEAGKEHRRRVVQLAGERKGRDRGFSGYSVRVPKLKPACVWASKPRGEFPPMRTPISKELATIARMRGWPRTDGLEVLVARGMLFTGEVYDDGREWPAWIVTDPTRRNAQARRMDGQPWSGIGGAKAKSLRGTSAGRCIGASLISEQTESVWLMEGTPDLLAAVILAKGAGLNPEALAFVGVTGAGNSLHTEDLAHFAGKPVTIAVHNDTDNGAGRAAAIRWAAQLRSAGAGVIQGFDFAAHSCNDLSDYLAASSGRAKTVAEAETTGEDARRVSADGNCPNDFPSTAKTRVPRGLCPKSWQRGILAPVNGPTALGNAYEWPEFTPKQIESDSSLGGEE